jgi:hypothetical protein
MMEREKFVARMQAALDELGLKAHLAELELRDAGDDVRAFRDRYRRLREATDDRWEALKDGVEASWHAFRAAYRRSKAGAETERR